MGRGGVGGGWGGAGWAGLRWMCGLAGGRGKRALKKAPPNPLPFLFWGVQGPGNGHLDLAAPSQRKVLDQSRHVRPGPMVRDPARHGNSRSLDGTLIALTWWHGTHAGSRTTARSGTRTPTCPSRPARATASAKSLRMPVRPRRWWFDHAPNDGAEAAQARFFGWLQRKKLSWPRCSSDSCSVPRTERPCWPCPVRASALVDQGRTDEGPGADMGSGAHDRATELILRPKGGVPVTLTLRS